MIQVTEKDDRLFLQFFEPDCNVSPSGSLSVSVAQNLVKEIDITAHIEKAALRAFNREIDRRVEEERKSLGEDLIAIIERDYSRFR